MTKTEALEYITEHAGQSFFGSVYAYASYGSGKYSTYFWGMEKECLDLWLAMNAGAFRPQEKIMRERDTWKGYTHLWYVNAPKSYEITADLLPFFEVAETPETKLRLRYMLTSG